MKTYNVAISNAQFTLYYLLIAADGNISEGEKEKFLNIMVTTGGFTRTYAESVFNAMVRFPKSQNYAFAIEALKKMVIRTISMKQ